MNCSLRIYRIIFLSSITLVCGGIGVIFYFLGAALILPFAGLELSILFIAFYFYFVRRVLTRKPNPNSQTVSQLVRGGGSFISGGAGKARNFVSGGATQARSFITERAGKARNFITRKVLGKTPKAGGGNYVPKEVPGVITGGYVP